MTGIGSVRLGMSASAYFALGGGPNEVGLMGQDDDHGCTQYGDFEADEPF